MHMYTVSFSELAPEGDAYFARHLVLDPPEKWPGGEPPWVNRDFYDVFVMIAGRGELPVLGSDGRVRVTRLRPGRIYAWRPQDHRRLALSTRESIEYYEVGVRAAEWQAFTSYLGIPLIRQTAPEAPVAAFDVLEDDVTPVFEAVTRAAHAGASTVGLVRFLVEIVPRVFSPSALVAESAPPWLFAGVEAMREEDNLRLGMTRFLELTRVSVRQLARLTRKYFGTTPGAMIGEFRVRHAMWLLVSTTESMSSIAERCGFGTAAHFSFRFRTTTGMSPRDYRQRAVSGFHGTRSPRPLSEFDVSSGLRRPARR